MSELHPAIEDDFHALFHEVPHDHLTLNSIKRQVPLILMLTTFLAGLLPLTLKFRYTWLQLRQLFLSLGVVDNRSVLHLLMIRVTLGMLLTSCFVCLLPKTRELLEFDVARIPNAEILISFALALLIVYQETVVHCLIDPDENYNKQRHLYLVYFLRHRLDVPKFLPEEPRSPREQDEAGEEPRMVAVPPPSGGDDALATPRGPQKIKSRPMSNVERIREYQTEKRLYEKQINPRLNASVSVGVVVLLAHSTLDGCALGMQATVSETFFVLTCFLAHRALLATTITIELMYSNFSSKAIVWVMSVYACAPAIGAMVGIMAVSDERLAPLLGIACGASTAAYLYTIFFETLRSVPINSDSAILLNFSTFMGSAVSAIVIILIKVRLHLKP
ncbi:uncharacterized protein LOC100900151 [Galendromus occidentalis]|uniref:Uncharacterized protein LOC100900151 n=1 Tax=Galendromus occidentalis TaxID=34638 RepID=A0AAJ7L6D9_9ACAR|nr:uncharacterized protein LOC100900151 [Galendromus occidentalis]